jgi:hypothetical protein
MKSKSGYRICYSGDGYCLRNGRGKTCTWKFQPGSGSLDRTTFHLIFRAVQSAIRANTTGDEFAQRSSIIAALVQTGRTMGCDSKENKHCVVWCVSGHRLIRFEAMVAGAEAEAFRRLKASSCVFRFFVNVQTGFITSFFSKAGQKFDKVQEEVAA